MLNLNEIAKEVLHAKRVRDNDIKGLSVIEIENYDQVLLDLLTEGINISTKELKGLLNNLDKTEKEITYAVLSESFGEISNFINFKKNIISIIIVEKALELNLLIKDKFKSFMKEDELKNYNEYIKGLETYLEELSLT